jgi:hypothetical protein
MTSNATLFLLKYSRHLKRLFAGPGTLESAAYRREIIHPEETATYLPAIYLHGQLERITGSPAESSIAYEIESATRLTGLHAPTIAYLLRDVAVVDGSVYHGTLRFFISKHGPTQSVRPRDIERAALVSSFYGSKYFGHWLRDDCTAYVLANDLNIPPLCFQSPSGRHMEGYKSLFDQDWTPTFRGRVKHLTVFSDYHENRLKVQRYEKLRSFVAARFPDRDYRSYVYLKRGKDGATRAVKNEDEIIAALVKNGFVVIDTGLTPLDKLLEILVNARIVVSVEGSHVSHCVYSVPRDSGLLILQPPDKFAANHRRWTSCLGIRFGFVVGTINEPGYQFDLTEILQTIDLLDRAIRRRTSN